GLLVPSHLSSVVPSLVPPQRSRLFSYLNSLNLLNDSLEKKCPFLFCQLRKTILSSTIVIPSPKNPSGFSIFKTLPVFKSTFRIEVTTPSLAKSSGPPVVSYNTPSANCNPCVYALVSCGNSFTTSKE